MRRAVLIGAGLMALGLGWWLWPSGSIRPAPEETEAPPVEPSTPRVRAPVAGARCTVRGVVEGGAAVKAVLHSVQAGIDVPAALFAGGRRFEAVLPEQGEIEAVVQAEDGGSASVHAVCDGSGLLELRVRLPASQGPVASSGRCLYLETGAPVSEARVVGLDTAGRPVFAALTDDEGRFSIPLPAGEFQVRCAKDGDESEAARLTVAPGAPARLELFLAARAGVTGTVREASTPVPGLVVRGRPAREGIDGREVRATTGPDGRYLLMGLPAGPVVVEVQDEGRFAEAQGVARVELPYAVVDLDLLEAAVIVEGFVTSDGAGLEGARVEVTAAVDRWRGPRPHTPRHVTAGPDGHYVVGGVALGRVRVQASAEGHVSARADVTAVPGRTRVDLRLSPACETTVEVGPAEPSRPVTVRVHRDGAPDVRASGRTGTAIVLSSAPGPAVLQVGAGGRRVATATRAVTLCAEPIQIDLGPRAGRGGIDVTAVDPNGAPVEGVRVWSSTPGGFAVTAKDGTAGFEDLEPGAYRVGTGDAPPVEVEVEADQVAQVQLEVDRARGEIEGEVVARGAPVEGAAILAACADSGRTPDLRQARVRTRSDAVGAFRFRPDEGGLCVVRAEHRREGRSDPVRLRAGGERGRIELLGSASIAGRVLRADGSPAPRYTLSVQSLGGAASVEGRTLRIQDPSGAFDVPDLPPGRVALIASAPSGRARTELELAPGDRRDGVELTVFGNAKVVGRVVDPDGAPIPGARLRIQASRRPLGRSRTGPDGAFSFSVPAGDALQVFASAEGYYPRGTEAFDVVADGPTDLGAISLEPEGDPEDKEGGIGIMFGPDPAGIRIIRFSEDSPAREAGLMVGDLITAIDGVPFGRDPLVNWVVTLRGVPSTPVVLDVQRGTAPAFTRTVIRRAIGLPAMPTEAAR